MSYPVFKIVSAVLYWIYETYVLYRQSMNGHGHCLLGGGAMIGHKISKTKCRLLNEYITVYILCTQQKDYALIVYMQRTLICMHAMYLSLYCILI